MGSFRHHTIIVTGAFKGPVKRAHRKARKKFRKLVSEIVYTRLNGFSSFFIAPDGSKEFWDESDRCDRLRAKYVAWLSRQVGDSGYSLLKWVEIMFGDEMGRPSRVVNDSTPPIPPDAESEIPF